MSFGRLWQKNARQMAHTSDEAPRSPRSPSQRYLGARVVGFLRSRRYLGTRIVGFLRSRRYLGARIVGFLRSWRYLGARIVGFLTLPPSLHTSKTHLSHCIISQPSKFHLSSDISFTYGRVTVFWTDMYPYSLTHSLTRHIIHRAIVRLLDRVRHVGVDLQLHVIDQVVDLPRGAPCRVSGAHRGGQANVSTLGSN